MKTQAEFQRLDLWLWHARVCRQRQDCVSLIEKGRVRINRQATTKPHAKIRIGDVLGLPGHARGTVRIWRIRAFSLRRGNAGDAGLLYEELTENEAQ